MVAVCCFVCVIIIQLIISKFFPSTNDQNTKSSSYQSNHSPQSFHNVRSRRNHRYRCIHNNPTFNPTIRFNLNDFLDLDIINEMNPSSPPSYSNHNIDLIDHSTFTPNTYDNTHSNNNDRNRPTINPSRNQHNPSNLHFNTNTNNNHRNRPQNDHHIHHNNDNNHHSNTNQNRYSYNNNNQNNDIINLNNNPTNNGHNVEITTTTNNNVNSNFINEANIISNNQNNNANRNHNDNHYDDVILSPDALNYLGSIDITKSYSSSENTKVRDYLDLVTMDKLKLNEDCSICLEEFKNKDEIVKLKRCTHNFHFHCLGNHLRRQYYLQYMNCPCCRANILMDFPRN